MCLPLPDRINFSFEKWAFKQNKKQEISVDAVCSSAAIKVG
jgi:hypothetical protein